MKIRRGFVSNSSSASFVLHTKFSKPEMKNILVNDMKGFFNKDKFKKEIEEGLLRTKEYLDKHNQDKTKDDSRDKLFSLWEKEYKESIKKNTKVLKELEKINSQPELVDYMLNYYRQEIQENQMGFACFSSFTTMWNDEDDMGELLCAIRDTIEAKHGHSFYMIEVSSDN